MRLSQNTKYVKIVGFLLITFYALIVIVTSIGTISRIGTALQASSSFMYMIAAIFPIIMSVAGGYLFIKLLTMFLDIYDALAQMQSKLVYENR